MQQGKLGSMLGQEKGMFSLHKYIYSTFIITSLSLFMDKSKGNNNEIWVKALGNNLDKYSMKN